MRATMRRTIPVAAVAALLLTGCSGDADPTPTPAATPSPEAAGDALTRWLTPVELDGAPDDLAELETAMLHERGPFARAAELAGDAALTEDEVREAAAAAAALDPQSQDEWIGAILAQVHGDYAPLVADTVRFDTSTGEGTAAPTSDPTTPRAVGSNHFAVVLDASWSMGERSGAGSRMDEAKAAIDGFVAELPGGSTVSLRIYGHEGSEGDAGRPESCASTDVVFDGDSGDRLGLGEALADVEPVGWTPLALAIDAARDDIPADATDGIVYVVTDGLETCDGDPVAAARALADSDVQPVVNVIGFQTGDADQAALVAIAEAGGGTFAAAATGADLDAFWQQERQRYQAAWGEWRQAEANRITAAGEENKREATALGERFKVVSAIEAQAGKDIVRELERQELMDAETSSAIWTWFGDRGSAIWNYGNDTGSDNWTAAHEQAAIDRTEFYEQADRSWSEYYSDGAP